MSNTAANRPPLRTYLFAPGHRSELFDKALASGADGVILDLEDAVAAADKERARAQLLAWLHPDRPAYVRINASDTDAFAADLALVSHPGVAGIFLPKAERADDIVQLVEQGARCVIPLVETAQGFDAMRTLCAAPNVQRLMFGTIDFQVDMGIDGEGDELLYFRSQMVLVSRLYGLQPPIDGVCTVTRDAEFVRGETDRTRKLGFGGKACIHPAQVAPVRAAYQPSDAERAWAQRVIEAFEASGGAAVQVDGAMVDVPVFERARAILAA